METTGKQLMDRVVAAKGGSYGDEKTQRNYATVSGGAVGALIGFYYGYSKQKNMLTMGIAGFIVGALFTRLMVK
jgi:hypothetical protein